MSTDLPKKWYADNTVVTKQYITGIELPDESFGTCKGIRHRGRAPTELANGYCMECWDKGQGGQLFYSRTNPGGRRTKSKKFPNEGQKKKEETNE